MSVVITSPGFTASLVPMTGSTFTTKRSKPSGEQSGDCNRQSLLEPLITVPTKLMSAWQ
jgi:hypothetical protein